MERRQRSWPVNFLPTNEACPPASWRACSPAKAPSSNIASGKNLVKLINPKEIANL